MKRTILIIGGTRFVGPQLVDLLIKRGDDVTIFSRGNYYGHVLDKKVKKIIGDRNILDDLNKIPPKPYDVVYDMCCFNASQANLLTSIISKSTKHIVFFSSAAVYAKPAQYPLLESSPLGEWDSFGDYGVNKAEAEKVYSSYCKDRNIRLTIFRPTYILGARNYFDRENYFFSRMLAKKPILMPGNGEAIVQFCFLNEVASIFLLIPLSQIKQIEIINIGSDDCISLNKLISIIEKIVDLKAKVVYIEDNRFGLKEDHFYDDLYPFPNVNLTVSNALLKNTYHISFRSLELGLVEIYKVWKENWDGSISQSKQEREILAKLITSL